MYDLYKIFGEDYCRTPTFAPIGRVFFLRRLIEIKWLRLLLNQNLHFNYAILYFVLLSQFDVVK